MKVKLSVMLLVIVLALSFGGSGWAAEEDSADVVLQLQSVPTSVGDTITVQVSANNITAKRFFASDVALYYNPTVLKCVEEPVMSQELKDSGVMVQVYQKIDEQKGLLRYVIGMTPEGFSESGLTVPSGDLNLFTVTFEVIGQGDINLQVAAKDSAPIYIENFPQGAEMYLGEPLQESVLHYEKVSHVVGEKGDALISEILAIDPITVSYGTEDINSRLPNKVSVKLDDGSVKEMGISWSEYLSSYDPETAGTYLFRGELQEEEGYRNYLGLFSILTVTVSPKNDADPTQPGTGPEDNKPDPSETLFQDLDTVPWAAEKITELAKLGIISGVSEDSFAPSDSVTRAQFAAMLTRAFGLLDQEAVCDFSDVDQEAWYYTAVASAKKMGITAGYEDNTFHPDDLITRQEMATMAYRTAEIAGISLPQVAEKSPFTDEGSIADYAAEAISQMQQSGIINGMGDGRFAPEENATRAQAAVIIYQLYQLK